MFLEGFIGDELNRIRNEQFSRINPMIASFSYGRDAGCFSSVRARVGTGLIRAGARLSGVRVDDCLDVVSPRATAQV